MVFPPLERKGGILSTQNNHLNTLDTISTFRDAYLERIDEPLQEGKVLHVKLEAKEPIPSLHQRSHLVENFRGWIVNEIIVSGDKNQDGA